MRVARECDERLLHRLALSLEALLVLQDLLVAGRRLRRGHHRRRAAVVRAHRGSLEAVKRPSIHAIQHQSTTHKSCHVHVCACVGAEQTTYAVRDGVHVDGLETFSSMDSRNDDGVGTGAEFGLVSDSVSAV